VEDSFSLGQDIIGWRKSKTKGETLRETVFLRKFALANNILSAGADPGLDTTNTGNGSEMKKDAEEWKLQEWLRLTTC
jgi:hypothetical protein